MTIKTVTEDIKKDFDIMKKKKKINKKHSKKEI